VSTRRRLVSVAAATATVAAMTIVSLSGSAGAAPRGGYLRLAGSAAPFASHARVTGAVAGSVRLATQIWLRPRDLAAAQRYATAVSTPGSALFHHYLSPAAYTTQFGASQAGAGAVESWLRRQGFTGIQADAQRNYVRATGTVAAIDAAFQTQLENYQPSAAVNAGPYQLRANDRAVSIPRSLSRYVLGVTGLDNAAPRLPLMLSPAHRRETAGPTAPCSRYYGQHQIPGLPRQFGRTSFPTPICGYSAGQLRAAYGANMTNAGRGQTVALVEWGLTRDMFVTLQDYAASDHFVAPSPHRYHELSLGKNTCGDPYNLEEQTDVEASYDMAPGANQLVVGGDSCNNGDFGFQALFDADIAIIDGTAASHHHPLANISSNSWGPGTDAQSPILTNIMHAYLVRAAAQGVGMYFASGDRSGVETPDDPFAVLVGGTSLGIGRHGQRLFETGWSTGLAVLNHARTHWGPPREAGASSGGPSLIWLQPPYQRGVVPRALATAPGGNRPPVLVRSEPDIAADADLFTGFAFGFLVFPKNQPPKFTKQTGGGTSIAAPLVAGMIADAQQGQHTAFGFTNPVLYRLNETPAVHDLLPLTSRTPGLFRAEVCNIAPCPGLSLLTFDDQNHTLFGYTGQVTLKGYDNMTGIGTPNGQAFITGMRTLEG
jgi:subtilase family serine protease